MYSESDLVCEGYQRNQSNGDQTLVHLSCGGCAYECSLNGDQKKV